MSGIDELDGSGRARLLWRLTSVMMALTLLGAVASLLEPKNQVSVTVLFYGLVFGWLATVALIARRGRLVLAAWLMTSMFWVLIAVVTLLFGGLQGQNAACFTLCVLLPGSVVGGRTALGMAVLSAAWCGLVAILERNGHLPTPLAPYSPINAWAAVTVTLLMTAVLLSNSLATQRALRERAEQSARERDQALRRSIEGQKMELVGKVTSGIAHDFNNLLTVIGSVSDVLRDDPAGVGADSLDTLAALDEATARATLLTRQLTAFGRPTAISDPAVAVDASAVLDGLARMLPQLLGPAITVTTELASGAPVAAPRAALEQIVLNLVVNARQAMPTGGRLRLAVTAGDALITLACEDDGAGMDAATQARIFEPFYTTKATGTGLGLATIRRLVTELGGSIRVDSAVGRGTRFEIDLPRGRGAVAATPAAPPAPTTTLGAGRRVLVVEDDPLVRRTLTRWLRLDGFEPVAVADGVEAVALAQVAGDLACVVSDLAMPRLDGDGLRAQLAAVRPGLPMVLISGDRTPTEPATAQVRFVPKPLTREALRAAIGEAVA